MPPRLITIGFALAISVQAQPAPLSPVPPPPDRNAVRRMFDPWRPAVPPRHLIANIHYVGAIGVSSFLITTPAGHILLDTGFEDTAPIIQRGVQQLGFRIADIKFILSSHAHIDHTGGHAAMKRLTGATILASAADARVLASGGKDDFIQFPADTIAYEPVTADRIVRDGETVTVGGTTLTAHLTPGHTKGSTTWTMQVNDGGRMRHVIFFSSASINPGTPLVGNMLYPAIADDLARTFAKLKVMPCDIFFAPHGGQFAMAEKFAGLDRGTKPNPFIDPDGWRTLIDGMERKFLAQLAAERAAARK
ncbi:MAG: subclass B3 metallo-beta-lactamase [Opitutus sp.]|nr:subclass B3 metallo-beta-lactamase [Opitutus sp.]